VEQRAEPPSWLPDSGQSRTGATADLRNPEADEAAAGTPDGDTGYNFSGNTSYSDSQDTTFGQAGAVVGGYSYDPGSPADTTSAVPPYPASLTEPAGGTTVAATARLAREGKIAPDETVVAVISGNGLKTLHEHPEKDWPEGVPCEVGAMEEILNDFRQAAAAAALR